MSIDHGNRSFRDETPRFRSLVTHLRRQYQESPDRPETFLLNPFQETHFDRETILSAAFSLLDVNHVPFYGETEQTTNHDDSFSSRFVGLQNHNLLNVYMMANGVVPIIQLKRNQWLQQDPFDCFSVRDLKGNIVALAKDQLGCRYLQRTMSNLPKEKIEMIFLEVIDSVCELMIDPFGNYVVQKLEEMCSEEQRTQILLILTKVDFLLVSICLNIHGTRAVLKLLENLTTPQQTSLVVTALSPGAVALTKDTDGHYVIQYCVKHFSHEDPKGFVHDALRNTFQ